MTTPGPTPGVDPFIPLKFPDLPQREINIMFHKAAMRSIRVAADARQAGRHTTYKSLRESLSPHEAKFVFDYAVGSFIATRRRTLKEEES